MTASAGSFDRELDIFPSLQAEAVEIVERELETAKDRLRTNVEVVEGINKSISGLESRHVETVERMKEVRIFWDKSSTNADFTIQFPTADASNAIIRIA